MTAADIRAAHGRIAKNIRRTPILETPSPIAGAPPVWLKLECLQHSGSFKVRSAFHNLLTAPPRPRAAPQRPAATTARRWLMRRKSSASERGCSCRRSRPPPRSQESGLTAPRRSSQEHPTPRRRIRRPRWQALISSLQSGSSRDGWRNVASEPGFAALPSTTRFQRILDGLSIKAVRSAEPRLLKDEHGAFASVRRSRKGELNVVIAAGKVARSDGLSFADWMDKRLQSLREEYLSGD